MGSSDRFWRKQKLLSHSRDFKFIETRISNLCSTFLFFCNCNLYLNTIDNCFCNCSHNFNCNHNWKVQLQLQYNCKCKVQQQPQLIHMQTYFHYYEHKPVSGLHICPCTFNWANWLSSDFWVFCKYSSYMNFSLTNGIEPSANQAETTGELGGHR